jgi:hypothetical protein
MNLFHSLVVCGAGLSALRCGGRSQLEQGLDEAGGGTGGTPDAAGSAGRMALGGASSVAGAPSVAGAGGAAGTMHSTEWQQWDCTSDDAVGCVPASLSSAQANAIELRHRCRSDRTRPKSSADCAPHLVFSCMLGVLANELGPINCSCLAPTPDEPCPCPERIETYWSAQSVICDGTQSYCGCAFTSILVK